jgi:hypothetical protein
MAKKNDAPPNSASTQRTPDRFKTLNANDYYKPFLEISDLLLRQERYVDSFEPKDVSSGWVLHKLRLSLERTRSIAKAQAMDIHNPYSEGDMSVCSCGLILNKPATEGFHLDHRPDGRSWEIDYSTGFSNPGCTKPCNCLHCDGDDQAWDSILTIAEEKESLARTLGLAPAEQQELFMSNVSISQFSESELEILSRIKSKPEVGG